jgi:hypothetical protein
MSKKLIIVTNSASATDRAANANERDLITGFLEGKGWHVWHWFEDLWLIKIATGEETDASTVYLELKTLISNKNIIVFDPGDNIHLRGNVPSGGAPWIAAHWKV